LEGKYQLESRLGQGGMGVVYKARHTYLKTSHAIKVILPDLVGNDPQLITRFRQEALAAAAIRHHNVVSVTDYGVVEGKIPFLVMEFVQGESLHDLLAREKRLSPEKAVELMSAICMGVSAAHRQGIVHRDIKPLNIIIQEDRPLAEGVKILDFGLAKIKSGELLGSFIQAQTTGLMGSPYYMAPEQWSDEEPDARSDIYSLGVMLFQMLAGDVPYKGGSIPAIMKKHLSDPPPTFAELGVQVPAEVEAAVMHSLEKGRDKRTPSVEALVEELRNAIAHAQNQMHTTSPGNIGVLPVSSLHVLTQPPQSKVFLNNTSVGESRTDGSLLLEGIQSGNHHLRVSHDGFTDWENNIICDGKPQQVVAQLSKPINPAETMKVPMPTEPLILHPPAVEPAVEDETMVSSLQSPAAFQTGISGQFAEEKSDSSGVLLFGGIAAAALILLSVFGIGIYWVFSSNGGAVGNTNQPANRAQAPPPNANGNSQPVAVFDKPDMIAIPGGTFKMGRDDGDLKERPAHAVKIGPFMMDRTEVTNGEYNEFVKAANYSAPNHWVNGQPIAGTETMPVRFVSLEDAKAFAAWRSKRDGVTYRLPTEEEWEYAARNGEKDSLYPWGDDWEDADAVTGVADSEPTVVGSKPQGKNIWGVVDLIGNVWEWTDTEIKPYPGSSAEIQKRPEKRIVVRGGSAHEDPVKLKITATFRADVSDKQKEKNLGFRLVRPQ
jgi:serine/threonine-protein kinase